MLAPELEAMEKATSIAAREVVEKSVGTRIFFMGMHRVYAAIYHLSSFLHLMIVAMKGDFYHVDTTDPFESL